MPSPYAAAPVAVNSASVRRAGIPTFVLALGLLWTGAADAMRCGNRIVTEGDIQAKVLEHCGEPVQKTRRLGYRAGFFPDYRVRDPLSVAPDPPEERDSAEARIYRNSLYGHTEVVIEEWIYNLGPHKLIRRITFENGIVVEVETLGRGYLD